MESEKIFRTKTGFCHILPDKLVLTRNGIRGSVAQVAVGNKMAQILVIYGVAVAGLLYSSFLSYQNGFVGRAVLLLLVAGYFVFGIARSIHYSATPVIERKNIRKIVFKKAVPGLTLSRFEVFFENTNGKIKKRLIMLPGSFSSGDDETKNALKLMQEEGMM